MAHSALQDLLIMAYNVGRDHGAKNTMPIEQGRLAVIESIPKLVEHVDPGDLARPLTELLK